MIQFWAEKLVLDVLDYCHRIDFPDALIYTCVDLLQKRLADMDEAAGDSETEAVTLPLSEVKMDDTTFKFSTDLMVKTTAPDNIGLLSDLDFDSIKPRLNLGGDFEMKLPVKKSRGLLHRILHRIMLDISAAKINRTSLLHARFDVSANP